MQKFKTTASRLPRTAKRPPKALLDDLVRRIVEAVHPLRIVLFGSAARGDMGPDSDLDVLVVMPDGVHRRKTAQKALMNMRGFGFAADIIVVTESDVAIYGDNHTLIIKPAMHDGVELYHA